MSQEHEAPGLNESDGIGRAGEAGTIEFSEGEHRPIGASHRGERVSIAHTNIGFV